jgi:hypothetical protein
MANLRSRPLANLLSWHISQTIGLDRCTPEALLIQHNRGHLPCPWVPAAIRFVGGLGVSLPVVAVKILNVRPIGVTNSFSCFESLPTNTTALGSNTMFRDPSNPSNPSNLSNLSNNEFTVCHIPTKDNKRFGSLHYNHAMCSGLPAWQVKCSDNVLRELATIAVQDFLVMNGDRFKKGWSNNVFSLQEQTRKDGDITSLQLIDPGTSLMEHERLSQWLAWWKENGGECASNGECTYHDHYLCAGFSAFAKLPSCPLAADAPPLRAIRSFATGREFVSHLQHTMDRASIALIAQRIKDGSEDPTVLWDALASRFECLKQLLAIRCA